MILDPRSWFPRAGQGMASPTVMQQPVPPTRYECETCETRHGEMFWIPTRRHNQISLRRLCSTCTPVRFKKEANAPSTLL